jgi:hypothetical protein
MSHADLAEQPDIAIATPPTWLHTLRVAVGWAVAAGLCAGIAWTTGTVAARHLLGVRVPNVPQDGEVGAAVELAVIGGGCGLLVGAMAELLLARCRGVNDHPLSAALQGLGGALTGGLGGGLSVPMISAFDSLPPELSSGLAWAVAGLLAGLAGGIGRRLWPEPDGAEVRRAATWAIAGSLGGALAGAGGVVVGELYFSEWLGLPEVRSQLFETITYTAGTGTGGGFLVGAAVGLLSGHGRRVFGSRFGSSGRLGLLGGLTGLVAGLAPLLAVGLGQWVPPEVGFGLAGAAAGLVAGVIGHAWTRKAAEPEMEVSDEGEPAEERVVTAARPRQPWVPMLRLLPVLAVSGLTFVAASAIVPPGTRVVLIAVGLLGLAVAYVQAGQERRIRELERRLRSEIAPPAGGSERA